MRRLLALAAAVAAVSVSVPVAVQASPAAPPDREFVVQVTIEDRRVVPIGLDRAADWGDVIIESGSATSPGLTEGTYLRRGIAYDANHLGVQDTYQLSFPEGNLVFQESAFWSGAGVAALLGGTGEFRGARGSALRTVGDGTQEWRITILGDRRVDLSKPTVMEFERELVDTSRITLASPGSTVGNMTRTLGRLLDDSKAVADYTAISTVVQDLSGSLERRAVQAMFEFSDRGTLFVNGMIVADTSALPSVPTAYVISGGTGSFVGAAGYAEYLPPSTWRFTTFGLTPGATPVQPTLRGPMTQTRYERVRTSGTAAGGTGDLVLAGGWIRANGGPRGHYNVSAQSVERIDGRQSLLTLLQFAWGASDRVLVLGLTTTGAADGPVAPVERAVIGGLGAYVGVSGSASMQPVLPTKWRTTYHLMR